MTVSTTILPHLGLVFVKFSGHVEAAEAVEAFEAYTNHADYSPDQKHLVDFSDVTGFAKDYAKLMELQAKQTETVMQGHQILFVYCAPTRLTQEMAQHAVVAWSGVNNVVIRILETEADALDVVGLPQESFRSMHQPA